MLTSRQISCLELMAIGGLTQKQIAAEIKVTEQTICNWKKKDEFMAEFQAINNKAVSELAPQAIKAMAELLNAKSESTRFMAAKDILNRGGVKVEDIEYEGDGEAKAGGNPFGEVSSDDIKKLIGEG